VSVDKITAVTSGRPHATSEDSTMKHDKGSPIIFVPLLLLLLIAGGAAGLGVYLGADDDETTVSAPLIPNPELGPPCSDLVGPRPTDAAQVREWFQLAVACIENRIEGTTYDAQGNEKGSEPVSGADGLKSVAVEGFAGNVIVVRWDGEVPQVVLDRVNPVPAGLVVTYVAGT
jgi:hypothetical protein